MCYIEPFVAACCGRMYVKVSKVPSCDDKWPKAKCAPELCIQITTVETLDTVCWRCRAERNGLSQKDRNRLRPGFDRAEVTKGLNVDITGRRRLVEEGGQCWFCNAASGCEACGAGVIVAGYYDYTRELGTPEPAQKGKGKRKATGFAQEARNEARNEGRALRSKKAKVPQEQQQFDATGYDAGPSHQRGSSAMGNGKGSPNWPVSTSTSLDRGNSRNISRDEFPHPNDYYNSESSSVFGNYNFPQEQDPSAVLGYGDTGQSAFLFSSQPQTHLQLPQYGTSSSTLQHTNYESKPDNSPTPFQPPYPPLPSENFHRFDSMPPTQVVDGVRQNGRIYEQPDNYGGDGTSGFDENRFIDPALMSGTTNYETKVQGIQGPHVKFDPAMQYSDYKPVMTTHEQGGEPGIDPRLAQNEWNDGLFNGDEDAFKDFFTYGDEADEESTPFAQAEDNPSPSAENNAWANTNGGIDFEQGAGTEQALRIQNYPPL